MLSELGSHWSADETVSSTQLFSAINSWFDLTRGAVNAPHW
jgi:hypothetical protein